MSGESTVEWIIGIAIAAIGALSTALIYAWTKFKVVKREQLLADAKASAEIEGIRAAASIQASNMQLEFLRKHRDALVSEIRAQIADEKTAERREMEQLRLRVSVLERSIEECERERHKQAVELRAERQTSREALDRLANVMDRFDKGTR